MRHRVIYSGTVADDSRGQSDWTVYRGTVERTREWFDGGNRLGGRDPLQKLFSSRGYFGEECCFLRRARGRGLTT